MRSHLELEARILDVYEKILLDVYFKEIFFRTCFLSKKMTEMDYPQEKKATKNWKLMNISIFFFQRKHFSKNTQLLRTMIYSRSKEVDTINRSSQPIINHSYQPSINLVQK